jgi:hypothetical protein
MTIEVLGMPSHPPQPGRAGGCCARQRAVPRVSVSNELSILMSRGSLWFVQSSVQGLLIAFVSDS